jgi:hypothetical protein
VAKPSVPAKTERICALCGWGENMAIHDCPPGHEGGPFRLHVFVPPECRDPFVRAAWFLKDYAELYGSCVIQDDGTAHDAECIASQNEMKALAEKFAGMAMKRQIPAHQTAADVLAEMLGQFGHPGAVWFDPASRRFRLSGEGFAPGPRDVCLGVYMPDASAAMIAEDIEALLQSETT